LLLFGRLRRPAAQARENDMILTLGAGNVSQLGPMILETLGARNALTAAELSSLVTGSSK